MFVKLLNGPRAGEPVEMRYADAKVLLDDGRAEYAFPPDPAPKTSIELPFSSEDVRSGKARKRKK